MISILQAEVLAWKQLEDELLDLPLSDLTSEERINS